MRIRLGLLAVIAALSMQAASAADNGFYSNLPYNFLDAVPTAPIGYVNGSSTNARAAQGFTMGTIAFDLNKVALTLGGGQNNGTPSFDLYSDNAGEPGSLIQNIAYLSSAIPSGPPTFYAQTNTSTFRLQANTKYWFVISEASGGSGQAAFNWGTSDQGSPQQVAGSGVTYLGTLAQANTGGPWTASNSALSIKLSGTVVVPEPSTYALATIASGLMALIARRRQEKGKS